MKTKSAYLNHMLGVTLLLLLAPVGIFAQEGYYGATQTLALGAEPALPALVARSNIYSGGGDGYYGAQQPSVTCAQLQQTTVNHSGHLMLVRGTKIRSSTSPLGIATCGVPRSNGTRALTDWSAPQNHIEYGGGGM